MSLRTALKALFFVGALVCVLPLIVLTWFEKKCSRSELVFTFCAQLLAVAPGWPGARLRGAYYFGTLDDCSWETHVGFGSIFTHRGASLAPRASLGAYCVVGHARLGSGVMVGSRVSIPSGKRQHLDEGGNLASGHNRFDTVTVGEGTWIGEGAILMADVGSQCIVSAGAVVGKAMPDATLIGGNPARVLRELEGRAGAVSEA